MMSYLCTWVALAKIEKTWELFSNLSSCLETNQEAKFIYYLTQC